MAPVVAEPQAPTRAVTSRLRPRRPRHFGRVIAVGLLLVLVVGLWIRHRIEQDHLRRPLAVVEQAAAHAHKRIAVLTPGTARHWSEGSGPSEQRVRDLVGPGNPFLEPVLYYFSWRHGSGVTAPPPGSRCYYFAAQQGQGFDADRVTALLQLCYLDSSRSASGSAWVAVD